MIKQKLIVLPFVICSILFSCSNKKELVSIKSMLIEMIDRDAQSRYPKTDFRIKQESSYNRASISPEDRIGWFVNHDFNSKDTDANFIRIEENNQQKEWVLMDHKGPGAIVRTWMPFLNANKPNTDIQIKIYLDGSEQPTLEGNMLGLFNAYYKEKMFTHIK